MRRHIAHLMEVENLKRHAKWILLVLVWLRHKVELKNEHEFLLRKYDARGCSIHKLAQFVGSSRSRIQYSELSTYQPE
jgi:hypothetical protein